MFSNNKTDEAVESNEYVIMVWCGLSLRITIQLIYTHQGPRVPSTAKLPFGYKDCPYDVPVFKADPLPSVAGHLERDVTFFSFLNFRNAYNKIRHKLGIPEIRYEISASVETSSYSVYFRYGKYSRTKEDQGNKTLL
ncbi:hypothetical protein BgiMline_033662 [Biomphalaria glabrata]|nr:hypothetical protein BgiMline_024741 [Biomphalaria glabrata]